MAWGRGWRWDGPAGTRGSSTSARRANGRRAAQLANAISARSAYRCIHDGRGTCWHGCFSRRPFARAEA
eukprot:7369229-Karenia_brevis.AAC.1